MIETERLIVKPLLHDELINYIKSPDKLAENLGLFCPSKSLVDEEVRDAILNDFLPNFSDLKKDPLFYTMWIMIEKNKNVIIGGICFHGEPDKHGEVEIGYGTDDEYRNKGYMTETIKGLIHWLKNNKKIKAIKAETSVANISSIKALEKNGFSVFRQIDDSVIMKLELIR